MSKARRRQRDKASSLQEGGTPAPEPPAELGREEPVDDEDSVPEAPLPSPHPQHRRSAASSTSEQLGGNAQISPLSDIMAEMPEIEYVEPENLWTNLTRLPFHAVKDSATKAWECRKNHACGAIINSSHRSSCWGCGQSLSKVPVFLKYWDLPANRDKNFVVVPNYHGDWIPAVDHKERKEGSQAKMHGKSANARNARLRLLIVRKFLGDYTLEVLEPLIAQFWRRAFNWTDEGREKSGQRIDAISKEHRAGTWTDPTPRTNRSTRPRPCDAYYPTASGPGGSRLSGVVDLTLYDPPSSDSEENAPQLQHGHHGRVSVESPSQERSESEQEDCDPTAQSLRPRSRDPSPSIERGSEQGYQGFSFADDIDDLVQHEGWIWPVLETRVYRPQERESFWAYIDQVLNSGHAGEFDMPARGHTWAKFLVAIYSWVARIPGRARLEMPFSQRLVDEVLSLLGRYSYVSFQVALEKVIEAALARFHLYRSDPDNQPI